ncbi:hypothetical protein J3R80_09055 [Aliiroseovarius sp. Z3]|uniref:hypothetical protein n=1 Tax=Aliiroseovarius sp. Z3 TaxID=2811402 RepID=UPI0023B33D07|nr:hypothetical protein [Aliiroseovarius sp. Z3]MDE9450614.1 hypothetical protein [Aliiroseovarius sp. Z3]
MTQQDTFFILAPVAEGRAEGLVSVLESMTFRPGFANPDNPLVPFGQFDQLHMARFFLVQANTWRDIEAHGQTPRPFRLQLAFLGDVDGRRDVFLRELVTRCADGLFEIFNHCEGVHDGTDLLRWMDEHNVEEAANYVNMRGRTVSQIREEAALATALRDELDGIVNAQGTADPFGLHRHLVEFVGRQKASGRLHLTQPARVTWREWVVDKIDLVSVPLLILFLSPLLVLLLPLFLLRLRLAERSDPEILPRPDDDRISDLGRYEDHDVTNPFSAFGDVKPGLFRRSVTTVALYLLNYAARHIYGRGYLTRVQTIHFARWVFVDDKRRVLFCSNYDGALESYMDDFVNKVAWGLNLVFSNGVGYPSTRFLIKGGAALESKFKRYLRNRQLPTQVWYKAYPGLTARDLARHGEIRKGLEVRPDGARALRNWLAKI